MAFKYSEPTDYIPKSVRKELGIGEFKKDNQKKDTGKSKQNTGKKK